MASRKAKIIFADGHSFWFWRRLFCWGMTSSPNRTNDETPNEPFEKRRGKYVRRAGQSGKTNARNALVDADVAAGTGWPGAVLLTQFQFHGTDANGATGWRFLTGMGWRESV